MADRNRELVPDNWSLVWERALTTGLCLVGWYSEHSGVRRRAELPCKGEEVLKGRWEPDEIWSLSKAKTWPSSWHRFSDMSFPDCLLFVLCCLTPHPTPLPSCTAVHFVHVDTCRIVRFPSAVSFAGLPNTSVVSPWTKCNYEAFANIRTCRNFV